MAAVQGGDACEVAGVIDEQFYPTPPLLASKMRHKFAEKPGRDSVVLEPSAGRGDLVSAFIDGYHYKAAIDAIEFNFDNQAILRGKGVNVIGHDFMEFDGRKHYSHIIMNPPFNEGVKHVLRAWDVLKNGELVALVNAETLRNPYTQERQNLARIIEDHNGDVEYCQDEFMSPDTQRRTAVEVAIIHLTKHTEFDLGFIDDLKPEVFTAPVEEGEEKGQDLALPGSTVENAVLAFDAAVKCLQDEIYISNQLKRNRKYYEGLLGRSIVRTEEEQRAFDREYEPTDSAHEFNQRYERLKESAWSHIFTATKTGRQLSRKAAEKVNAQFEEIKKLEFTEGNIYGLLRGLSEGRGEMNTDMMLEVFDLITKYHSENRCYYMGWKSNDRHKVNAYRVGMTRFILPIRQIWTGKPDWEGERMLYDFDLAFAALDGKDPDQGGGVLSLFTNDGTLERLKFGERVSSRYFDIRFYPGRGTVHFFPREKTLVDRLNRIVGRHRQWLPPEGERVSDQFWLQYDKAESITNELRKDREFKRLSRWDLNAEEKQNDLGACIETAVGKFGIDVSNLLEAA